MAEKSRHEEIYGGRDSPHSSVLSLSSHGSIRSADELDTIDDEPPPYSAVAERVPYPTNPIAKPVATPAPINQSPPAQVPVDPPSSSSLPEVVVETPEQWSSRDPRSNSTQSLGGELATTDSRRKLLLVYVNGSLGGDTNFGSFPAHVHSLVSILLEQSHVVHTKVYPQYLSEKDLRSAGKTLGQWFEPYESRKTDVILLGQSLGGLLAAEVVLLPTENSGLISSLKHDFLGTIGFDAPYLGMHPRVLRSSIDHILQGPTSPQPSSQFEEPRSHVLSNLPNMSTVNANAPSTDDTAPAAPDSGRNAASFLNKYPNNVLQASQQLATHLELGGTLSDFEGLKARYVKIRMLEVEDGESRSSVIRYSQGVPPRVRFANYYTAGSGMAKKKSIGTVESELAPLSPTQSLSSTAHSVATAPPVYRRENNENTEDKDGSKSKQGNLSSSDVDDETSDDYSDGTFENVSDLDPLEGAASSSRDNSKTWSEGSSKTNNSNRLPPRPLPAAPKPPQRLEEGGDVEKYSKELETYFHDLKGYHREARAYHRALRFQKKDEHRSKKRQLKANANPGIKDTPSGSENIFDMELEQDREGMMLANEGDLTESYEESHGTIRTGSTTTSEDHLHDDYRTEASKRDYKARKRASKMEYKSHKHEIKARLDAAKDEIKSTLKAAREDVKREQEKQKVSRKTVLERIKSDNKLEGAMNRFERRAERRGRLIQSSVNSISSRLPTALNTAISQLNGPPAYSTGSSTKELTSPASSSQTNAAYTASPISRPSTFQSTSTEFRAELPTPTSSNPSFLQSEQEQISGVVVNNPLDNIRFSRSDGSSKDAEPSTDSKRKDKCFCILPSKDALGNVDPTWIRMQMGDVNEVEAHCSLFIPSEQNPTSSSFANQVEESDGAWSERYARLVGDVAERMESWVHDAMTERLVSGIDEL